MMKSPCVIVTLPIGEFDSDLVRSEYNNILGVFAQTGATLVNADPVSNAEQALQSVQTWEESNPDLLVIIPLRGLSAQAIESVALASRLPCLIWPIQGKFGLPSSVLARGALREAKLPVELYYAPPGYADNPKRLGYILRAARAFSRLRKSRIGVIGNLFANLVSCRYDPKVVKTRLGVSIYPISYQTIREQLSQASTWQEFNGLRQEITGSYRINSPDHPVLDNGIKLHLVLKRIALEQSLDGFAAECWTGLPKELGLNPCLGFIEDEYSLACEGDVMLCISLLIVRHFAGIFAYTGDLFDLDLDGILTLVHCGAPASLASQNGAVVVAKSQAAMDRGFETLTCRPALAKGPVTLFRFYGNNCDQLHLTTGELLDSEQSPNLKVKIRLTGDRWDFLDQCFGNHYLVVSGDIRDEIRLLSKWLEISVHET